MALNKKVVPFILTEGLDTKADEKVLPPPSLLMLENARRNKAGRISKRWGHQAIGSAVAGSATDSIDDADALGKFDEELLIFRKQKLYSYSSQAETSAEKGGCVSAAVTVDDIVRNNQEQTQVDIAVYNDIALFAYEDTRNSGVGIYATVRDNKTGAILLRDWLIASSGSRPRCVSFKGHLYLYYYDSGAVKCFKINPMDPATIPGAVTVTSSINTTDPNYDVITQDEFMMMAINVQGSTATRLHKVSESLSILGTTDIAEASTDLLTAVRGASSYSFIIYHDGTDLRCAIYDVFLSVVVSPFAIETISNCVGATAYALPDNSGIRVFYEVSAAATYNHFIRTNTVTNGGVAGTPELFLRSVGIASKAWAYSPDTTDYGFLTVVHESSQQSTFFVVRSDKMVVGKAQAGIAGGLLTRPESPSNVALREAGKYQVALLSKRKIASEDQSFVTLKGISAATFDFSDLRNFSNAELAGNALIVGGLVQGYDAHTVVEHGFNLYPENVTLAESTGGSLSTTGVYSYMVCYEWTDNNGLVHRSAPSTPVQITLTASNNRVTVTVPTLRLTQKRESATGGLRRDDCRIVVYRTADAGEVWYEATSPTSPTYNDPTTDVVAIVDDLADASLISRQPIYTTGGILENIAPPSANLITTYRNRVVLGGTEDDTVWISKQVRPLHPVEFNDSLTIKVDPVGGPLRGVATLDDKLIFLKENSIFYTYGDGPDDRGIGPAFPPPEKIQSDAGCVDSKSVVEVPSGLMFKSRKGYYLLTRARETQYIGAAVEDWNDYSVTSATLVSDANEVKFTTQDGPTLVYNYFFNEWYVSPLLKIDDALEHQDQFTAIIKRTGTTSKVVKETKDFWLDIDQIYSLRLKIASAALAGVQGLQRLYRAIFLGEYKSPHKLKLSVGYNYTRVVSDEYLWDAQSSMGITEYGDGAVYGSDPVYGGELENVGTYQIRTHISQQKCQAATFTLEDVNPSGTCESFNISAVAFEVGMKKGAVKLQPAQTQ